jgi:hypothetical protein
MYEKMTLRGQVESKQPCFCLHTCTTIHHPIKTRLIKMQVLSNTTIQYYLYILPPEKYYFMALEKYVPMVM